MDETRHLTVAAIVRSPAAEAELRLAATGINGTRIDIQVAPLSAVTHDNALLNRHDVLLLDVDPRNPGETEQFVEIVRRQFPAKPILVAAAHVTLEAVKEIMGHGAADVLAQPLRQADLLIALDHVARKRASVAAAPAARGKVISFLKGGCGVGATTLAIQGGCLLAGEEAKDKSRVCLLDFDLQFGTAGLYLDLSGAASLLDLLEAPERLDRALLRGSMVRHDSGLEVLLSPSEVMPLESVTTAFIAGCLAVARQEYDTILVDLPYAWTDWTFSALRQSDLIVLVSELTVASVRQTMRQLETLRAHDLPEANVRLVLNRHEQGWRRDRSADAKDAERALGRQFDYLVANDYRLVCEAANRGLALAKVKKGSRVEKDLRALVHGIQQALAQVDQTGAGAVAR